MTIVSANPDGVRAETAAKESVGNAATLGSQTAAAADEVIVPDAIGSNNESNLEGSPTYVGRMIAIRPWEMRLAQVPTVQAGGSSYAVSDTIDLNGVAGITGAPVLTVTAVSSGAVTAVEITEADGVDIRRGGMTSAPSPADNPVGQAATSGSGTGATFNCIWEPHFELRFITADASNTLTVHEPWDVPAVSGDNWAVSYILEDYATLTGLTLRAQSGVFEATRRIKVGPETDGARRGWLAMNGGKALELDNVTDNTFEIADGGIFTMGYLQGGNPVNGAYISTSGAGGGTGPQFIINLTDGGALHRIYDVQVRSPREALGMSSGEVDADERLFRLQAQMVVQAGKLFDMSNPFFLNGYRLRDITIQRGGNGTVFEPQISLEVGGDSGASLGNVNRCTFIGMTNSPFAGFKTGRTVTTLAVTIDFMRNIIFLDSTGFCFVEENETWQFVNPVWAPVLTDQSHFDFDSTTGSSIEELMSLIVRPVTPGGVAISGVHGYIYEGGLNDDLPTENTEQSDSAPYDPIADSRFEDEILSGAIAYFCDVLRNVYTPNSTTDVLSATRDIQAWRGYDYGNLPVTIALTINLNGGIDTNAVFLLDDAITETDQATALTNPTTNPTVVKHGPGESDTRPMKALNYDGGTGSAPTIGEVMTEGSATGVVVDFEGDGVAGTLLLDTWNGVEFADGQNITGGTSTFDATTDTVGFYEEYTWEINSEAQAGTILYDYLAARMAEDPITGEFSPVIIWGGDEPDANQLLFLGTTGYFTNRAVRRQDGRVDPAATRDFSDTFTRADEALAASADWDDVDNAASGMQLISNAVAGDATAGQTNVGAVALATHTYVDDQYAEATVSALPTAGDLIGVALRIDSVREQCYAAIVREGTPDTYEIVLVDFSTAAGVITTLATGASTPTAADVIQFVAVDNTLIMFIDGVEEIRYVDDEIVRTPLTSGQAGLMAEGDTAQVGRVDGFGSGDFVAGITLGEGVWPHDRGAGEFAFFTSDSGATFVPPATVTLTVQVDDESGDPVEGARVRIAVSPDVIGSTSIAEGETNSSGTFSASFTFTSPVAVITKVRLKGFKNFRTTGTITSTGLTVGVTFLADNVVDLP